MGIPLPAKGVRTSNHGRSMDRRDVWVGLKPIERLRTSRGRRCRAKKKAKENERENLFQVKRKKCVYKEFDRADIVRDALLGAESIHARVTQAGGRG